MEEDNKIESGGVCKIEVLFHLFEDWIGVKLSVVSFKVSKISGVIDDDEPIWSYTSEFFKIGSLIIFWTCDNLSIILNLL